MNQNKIKIIYKRNTNGTINQWQIITNKNSYYTIEGIYDGKLTQSKPTMVKGKNIGRSNETTDFEQACKEAESKYAKKIESGYTEDINKIDTAKKFFAPMLAKKYVDYIKQITTPFVLQRKYDGSRLIAMKDGLFTSNGKTYVSFPHIHKLFKA